MAAVDLALDSVQEIQLSATPNTMQEVTFPLSARRFRMQFRTYSGKLVQNGGADATVITTEDYHTINANQLVDYDVPGTRGGKVRNNSSATRKIWVASPQASTVVEITALP
jgi:hypothetical protein